MDAEQNLKNTIGVHIDTFSEKVGDFTIHYAVAGSGPTVLLLHGANMGWGQWYPNIEELSKKFTVYALDFFGAGKSTPMHPWSNSYPEYLISSIEKFIINKNLQPINLIGHSLGAWVALNLALRQNVIINKMVLVSPLGFTTKTPLKYKLVGVSAIAKTLSNTVMKVSKKNMKKFAESVFYNPSLLKPEFVDYYHESIEKYTQLHPFLFINRLASFNKVRKEFIMTNSIHKISNPTLIIIGDKDPIISLKKNLLDNFNKIPKVRISVFKNSGHVPSTEDSIKFNKIVIDFLKN